MLSSRIDLQAYTQLQQAKESFRSKVADLKVSNDNIIQMLKLAIECIEIDKLPGNLKREAVIDLIQDIIFELPLDDVFMNSMQNMIENGLLGYIIDLVVAASKGNLDINASTSLAGILCKTISSHTPGCLANLAFGPCAGSDGTRKS